MKNDSAPLGIYIHIPFCRKKCDYCDFCSVSGWDERLLDRYLTALLQSIRAFSRENGRLCADTVYIGGGTPSVFGPSRLTRLLQTVREGFSLAEDTEITVEVNPESGDEALFLALRDAGVNRISMGVQSADDGELRAIGRIHDFSRAGEAVRLCRALCTDNISLDLMFGLPGQTMESWMRSLDAVCDLKPRHVSCYALRLEEGTPLYLRDPVRPDDDLQADMYLAMVSRLQERGYDQYEISNFAEKGFRSRHNQKYWHLTDYVGFGCAAHSFFRGKRFYYTSEISDFCSGAWNDPLPEDEETGSREEEYVMLALRTTEGISEAAYTARFGKSFAPVAHALEPYEQKQLVVRRGDCRHFTPEGFLVSNAILVDVLDALENREGGLE